MRSNRQHAVNRAGVLFRGLDRGRRRSGGPLIGVLDAVPGEGGYTVLTDPIDPQTAIFGNMSIESSHSHSPSISAT
jgi:hypothetical protein